MTLSEATQLGATGFDIEKTHFFRYAASLPETVAMFWVSSSLSQDHKYLAYWEDKAWVCVGKNPIGFAIGIEKANGEFNLYIEVP